MTPQEFVHKWKKSQLKERAASQEHFLDLCRMIDHPSPASADATGESFTFEKGTDKTGGGKGFADVWKRGYFGWEYKGKHKNLDAAYNQLLTYREALENPPLLVVSDMERIVIHTNFTNSVKRVTELSLDDLLTPDGMKRLKAVFTEPASFKSEQTTDGVTAEAAKQFATLSGMLRSEGTEPDLAAHFLIRLLFCLFAEDVGLLPNDTLKRLIETTKRDPEEFSRLLGSLFGTMATGGYFGLEKIPYFNGALFDDDTVLPLDRDALDIIETVSLMDWGSIEPSIFGTLFERSLDPAKRSQLGAHYTSREDILLIVEPVLMRPLRRKWEEIKANVEDLIQKRDKADTKRKKDNRQNEIREALLKFSGEIAAVKVLDPACGSGNFLYVALRQLLDLEKEVIQLTGTAGLPVFTPSVNPTQLHGIELNPYAHELASATIWIGYIQWLRDNGFGFPEEPILRRLDTIQNRDAILAFDAEGNPYEPEWPAVDVIIGNPPFLGDRRMREELGESYTDGLRLLYKGQIEGVVDFVCYWFERASQMIAKNQIRVGLIATNSIRYGDSRKVLDKIKSQGNIFFAWSDRSWTLDGAAVRVSIVGFDNGNQRERQLNGASVSEINADLTSEIDLSHAAELEENRGIAFSGTKKYGPFEVPSSVAKEFLHDNSNPNGIGNSQVIRPWVNGIDITRKNRNMWIVDFDKMTMEEAAQFTLPFEYVKAKVKPTREEVRNQKLKVNWWLFEASRPKMQLAISTLSRFIVTPAVSKHRVFVWLSHPTMPDQQLIVFARDDDYFFGVLHSQLHELWVLRKGNRLGVGNDPRYNATVTLGTFPFPYPPGKEPKESPLVQAIGEAAKELVEKRDRWLNPESATEAELKKRTLTNLYNQRPTWLDLAHKKLDKAVYDAYEWSHDLTDEQILERLLALNLERAGELKPLKEL